MHNLALALHKDGNRVTGSDDEIFEPSRSRLDKEGLLPKSMGWNAERITKELDAVIVGMHAKKDNPELARARELNLPIYSYPEFLYEKAKHKTRVVIGGSHGKTTVTGMILHVLHFVGRHEDYMVGAQLDGFETMVKFSDSADFMVLEGDEYLSSPLDLTPKFHHYRANIALLTGIAWDHINVFPTFENYVEQFRIFIEKMESGGVLIYNEEDEVLRKMVEENPHPVKKMPYRTPEYSVEEGTTVLHTHEGDLPLRIFGRHNLQNLEGARLICNQMGVMDEDFYEAIATFSGAQNRLERLATGPEGTVYKDFAHAPSKVKATVAAVHNQYPESRIVAVLELHTYSSLNPEFLEEYKNTLDQADAALVFYDPHAMELKGMKPISPDFIRTAFDRADLEVSQNPKETEQFLHERKRENTIYLLMSSGNMGGIDRQKISEFLAGKHK